MVRNTLRTHHVPSSKVFRFEIQRMGPVNKQLRVVLRDGRRIPLKVTYRVDVGKEPGCELAELLTRFNAWMSAANMTTTAPRPMLGDNSDR